MFCSNCGAVNANGTIHCSNCGRALTIQSVAGEPGGAAPAVAPYQTGTGASHSQTVGVSAAPGMAYQALPYAPTDGKATASLVLGVLSIMGGSLFAGVPAIILGHISRSNIKASAGRLKGKGVALTGLITGYVGVTIIPVLMVAAFLMPNLVRARQSANASSAKSTVRSILSAQGSYSSANPGKGFAMDLASLGPVAGLDKSLSRSGCVAGSWCAKNGYRYSLTGFCNVEGLCTEFVIVATPARAEISERSFCSTSDGVLRERAGPPLQEPLTTAAECAAWSPV